MMWLALIASAAAGDSGWEDPCQALSVRDTIPRLHTERTPIDVQPLAVMLDEKPCTPPDEYELLLYERVSDGEPVLLHSLDVTAQEVPPSTSFSMPLDFELEPDGRYRLLVRRVEGDGYDALTQVDFLTGTERTQGLTGVPSAPDLSIAWSYRTEDGRYRVQVGGVVSPALDPDDLSVLELQTEDGLVVETAPVYGTLPVGVVGWWVQDDRPKQVCLTARQIDGAGRAGEPSEPGCVEVERGQCEGCAAGGAGSGLGALAALLLALQRRRRR